MPRLTSTSAPERLHLEITETALLTASATLADELRTQSELGVHIALDDFLTGYSSLTLLRHFPVDLVEIDRSFVESVLTDFVGDGTVTRMRRARAWCSAG